MTDSKLKAKEWIERQIGRGFWIAHGSDVHPMAESLSMLIDAHAAEAVKKRSDQSRIAYGVIADEAFLAARSVVKHAAEQARREGVKAERQRMASTAGGLGAELLDEARREGAEHERSYLISCPWCFEAMNMRPVGQQISHLIGCGYKRGALPLDPPKVQEAERVTIPVIRADGVGAITITMEDFEGVEGAGGLCSTCLTKAAGLPVPGYPHDPGCRLALQEEKAERGGA